MLYGFLLFPDELKPVLGARSLLGHNGNQLNTLFHIDLVLLYRLAIETIGNLPQRMDIAGKTFLDQLVSQCAQFGALNVIDSRNLARRTRMGIDGRLTTLAKAPR